ncbi:MAG: hypothetical protein AAF849_00915 [Bacteroidota bacterium]
MGETIRIGKNIEINKRKARMASGAVLLLLVVVFLFPFFTFPDPPPEQEGILVNLGLPDQGQGVENAPIAEAAPAEPEPQPEPVEEPEPEPTPPKETKPQPVEDKKVVTTEDPDAIRLKRQKEEQRKKDEAARQKQREEEARRKAQAEAERQRIAAEAAERERQEAERNATKSRIGDLFKTGDGKGNTGSSGNQGDPNGDPDASRLEGISTGTGQVGGGLAGRGGSGPKLTDSSQKAGQVVIYVCVDDSGRVTSAKFTQKGSSGRAAGDSALIKKAIDNAKRWKFKSGTADKQCGTISYRFKFG